MKSAGNQIKSIIFIFSLIVLSACQTDEEINTGTEISPFLFGQNLWLTDGQEGRIGYIQESLWPRVQESGAKMIRIGGNGYDQHVPDFETLDMWVRSIKAIGAEPMMQISKYESAEKAAELVRHFNKETELYIKYWALGNEPYHIHHWSIDSISEMIKSHSTAMKQVDPDIKLFAPDAAAYYNDLYEALLLNNKTSVAGRDDYGNWYIDGVTFHNYPNGKNYSRSGVIFYSSNKMRGMMMDLKKDLEASNEKYQRFGKDALVWGLTEFNITYNNPDYSGVDGISVRSFINGQFWAEIFGMSMEYGAFCVTPWCIQESDRDRTYFGYIGGPPDFTPHATFYHMQMMSDHMRGSYLKVQTNNPYVKALASFSGDQTVLMLMNQNAKEAFTVDLSMINEDAFQDFVELRADIKIEASFKGVLESQSTNLFVFDKQGNLQKHLVYTMEMAMNDQAPTLQ